MLKLKFLCTPLLEVFTNSLFIMLWLVRNVVRLQVEILLEEFPSISSDLLFVQRLLTEESVFCLPSQVRRVILTPGSVERTG